MNSTPRDSAACASGKERPLDAELGAGARTPHQPAPADQGPHTTLCDPSESALLADVLRLMDEDVLQDRSERPLRPIATVVGSARNKDRDEDASQFVRELREKYPFARLVVSAKSPVEKSAAMTALSMGMPCEVVKAGEKGDWDEGAVVLDERCVAASSHVVCFDESARSKSYQVLAKRQGKHVSVI